MEAVVLWPKFDETLNSAREYTDQIVEQLPKGMVYKGAVSYQNNLPTSGNTIGDCYTVKYKGTSGTTAWGAEFCWGKYENVDQWIRLGADVSVIDNLTSTSTTDALSANQGRLLNNAITNAKTLRPMKSAWKTGTTEAATTAILNDSEVNEGDGYLATVYWTDLPGEITQAEVKAFILKKGSSSSQKILQFECTSGTVAPYAWFYNSYEKVWRSYVPINNTLTSTSTSEALSANQGKTLKGLIDGMISTPTIAGNGLEIADTSGNIALSIDGQGHLTTKKFSSAKTPQAEENDLSSSAFELADASGNIAFAIKTDGSLKTATFNSNNTVASLGGTSGNIDLDSQLTTENHRLGIKVNKRYINPVIDTFLLSGHRGASDAAHNNTMAAFDLSRTRGFKAIECDVRYTSDSQLVLFHDDAIGGRAISSYTLTELQTAYNYIPTVEKLLRWAKIYNMCIEFDCATRLTDTLLISLYNLIDKWHMLHNCIITGTKTDLNVLVNAGLTDITVIGSLWTDPVTIATFTALAPTLRRFNYGLISIDMEEISSSELPQACHNLGLGCKSWTPTTKEATQALFDYGVDMINVDSAQNIWVLDY